MEIIWTPKALKQLSKLKNKAAQKRIVVAVRALVDFPDTPGVKALTNHRRAYRLRVGDYRILFDVFDQARIISIEEVKKRDERTY